MTNQIALFLFAVIVTILVADHFWLHLGLPVMAGKQIVAAVEYLSFWR